jgi:hypothetical protein
MDNLIIFMANSAHNVALSCRGHLQYEETLICQRG